MRKCPKQTREREFKCFFLANFQGFVFEFLDLVSILKLKMKKITCLVIGLIYFAGMDNLF